jgi:hypothetical protein
MFRKDIFIGDTKVLNQILSAARCKKSYIHTFHLLIAISKCDIRIMRSTCLASGMTRLKELAAPAHIPCLKAVSKSPSE